MSDRPEYTHRELVNRERAAFLRGLRSPRYTDAEDFISKGEVPLTTGEARAAEEALKRLYPHASTPRVVEDPHVPGVAWKRSSAAFLIKTSVNGQWLDVGRFDGDTHYCNPTPERVAMWADLIANPTTND